VFCLKEADITEMALLDHSNDKLWAKKIAEGKCGEAQVPFYFSKLLATAYVRQTPTFILEMKLKLKDWPMVYGYARFKPSGLTEATYKPEYENQPASVREWYRNAELTEAAKKRFQFKRCCDHSDVFHTQFRVNKGNGQDEWYYKVEGKWKRIPPDIVHWGEAAPDGQPTLFIYADMETCFYPGESGI
jgi:hypothetical protein